MSDDQLDGGASATSIRGSAYTSGRPRQADGVDVVPATSADLQRYTDAAAQLGQMQVPVLVSSDRPNERLFVAVLDGTGNDRNNPDMGPQTGVAQIFQQIRAQETSGEVSNVAAGYLRGPGTQSGWLGSKVDGAQGHTFEERTETMYRQFIEQSGRWLAENPDADIRVAAIGFSRGAEQAAFFTRLVHERGIQDPTGAVYTTNNEGLVTGVNYTKPPLVEPGQVIQAAVLQDPVATGDPRNYDRRLPPSVVSALQITARDETRDQFVGTPHLPGGMSDGNRSLNITVPGAHSNIGDGYEANGLGIRNTNMTMQYLNGLVDNGQPLLQMRPEPQDQNRNVIHDSEGHLPWVYTRRGFDRDGVRDENTQLGPTTYVTGPRGGQFPAPVPDEHRVREPMDQGLSGQLGYRALPMAPVPELPGRRADAGEPVPTNTAALFDQLANRALARDAAGMCAVGDQYINLAPQQNWLQEGRAFNLEQASQRDREQAATPIAQPQVAQPQILPPAMEESQPQRALGR